jgi:hypothetical protein
MLSNLFKWRLYTIQNTSDIAKSSVQFSVLTSLCLSCLPMLSNMASRGHSQWAHTKAAPGCGLVMPRWPLTLGTHRLICIEEACGSRHYLNHLSEREIQTNEWFNLQLVVFTRGLWCLDITVVRLFCLRKYITILIYLTITSFCDTIGQMYLLFVLRGPVFFQNLY